MIKVCHLTSVHKWNDVRIFEKECVSLARAGFDVSLVAVHAEGGVVNGVKVVPVKAEGDSRFARMTKTVNKVYQAAVKVNADIYHFHDPELLRVGIKLMRIHGKKVIYDAHEDLPRQILDKTWIPSLFRGYVSRRMERYENRVVKELSAVVAATPHIAMRFTSINALTVNVNNYPFLEKFKHDAPWSQRGQEICYVGGIFATRGVMELVRAMESIPAQLNLAGNYSPASLRGQLTALPGWNKVKEYGFVGRAEIVKILDRSKVGVVTLHPTVAYKESLPVKMFEYMAAGIPVVASDFPLWKTIIEKHHCGICVDPLNPPAIAAAVNRLLASDGEAQQMGSNGQRAVEREFNWELESKKLVELYQRISKS